MNQELNTLKQHIVDSYRKWTAQSITTVWSTEDQDRLNNRVADFESKLSIKDNSKYIKIISNGSVWGFVVKVDDGIFRRGDILKAASWNAPAKNKARGNILDGDFSWVEWTGPAYL